MKHSYEFKQISASVRITGPIQRGSVADYLSGPYYEPVARNHDGWRHHRHRFPIKGGISHVEVVARDLMKRNAIYDAFFGDGK